MPNKKVLVAMSGGVDSSVAAALLKEQGYDCIGVTMQLWDYSQNETSCDPNKKFDTCCSLDDVADARMVAHKLNIPFYVFNYQESFKSNVVDYFIREYLDGQTPNPCVACNTFLKFDLLLERAKSLGCNYIATGHYAKIVYDETKNEYKLLRGDDSNKDQSYFLYSMNQDILKRTLFPVGDLTKQQVREIAEKYSLVNAQKKESMEICFIPNNDYAAFIKARSSESDIIKGKIFHEDGQFIDNHDGIHKFTIGQRKGLGFATGEKVYVTRINKNTGNVYVGSEKHLLKNGFKFRNFSAVSSREDTSLRGPLDVTMGAAPAIKLDSVTVKIRYRANQTPANITFVNSNYQCHFQSQQKSVTPGQVAVVYHGNEVIGGGFIDAVF